MSAPCFLAQFSDRPCDGRLVRVHLLPRQLIARALQTRLRGDPYGASAVAIIAATNDKHGWVKACGGPMGNAGHHGMLDSSRTLWIPRHAIPAETEEMAAELGLEWWLEREYGPRHGPR